MLYRELLGVLTILAAAAKAQDGGIGRRVPSFIGMRGKKSDVELDKEIAAVDLDGGGGDGGGGGGGGDKYEEGGADEFRPRTSKRAHLGFQGTRGKKVSELPFKRYVGFTGTRGKKFDSLSYPRADDLDDLWFLRNELAKRKFYGTRGKKLLYPLDMMGARGKKGPSSTSFFGTRGKKSETAALMGNGEEENSENSAPATYTLTREPDYLKNFDFDTNDFGLPSSQYRRISINSDVTNA